MPETNEHHHNGSAPTPEEWERRGNAIREDLDRTLKALEHKFSPREMASRSVAYLRDHSLQLLEQTDDMLRQHPGTVLLAAVGLTWLGTAIVRRRRGAWFEDDSHYDDNPTIEAARH